MIKCPPDGGNAFKIFDDPSIPAIYKDNVQSYSTTEPAIDLTSTSFLMWSWRSGGESERLATIAPMRCALLFGLVCLIAGEPAHQRDFTFEYNATVKDIPAGTQKLDLWIPVPHDDLYQRITDVRVDTPYPHQILTGDQGNTMLHLEIAQPKESSVPVTLTFHAVRLERIQPVVLTKANVVNEGDLSRWLKPDRLVPIDGQIHTWAQEIVDAAHAKTDLEMARAIYNHVVSTVKYDKTGKGWGAAISTMPAMPVAATAPISTPSSSDTRAPWVSRRASPSGFRYRPIAGRGRSAAIIAGRNFTRRELDGCRWMASEAAKNPRQARVLLRRARRESRWAFSKGRDVVLDAKAAGRSLELLRVSLR